MRYKAKVSVSGPGIISVKSKDILKSVRGQEQLKALQHVLIDACPGELIKQRFVAPLAPKTVEGE